MPDPTITMRMLGDSRSAQRAVAEMEKKLASMENKLKHTIRTSKRAKKSFAAMGSDLVKSKLGMAALAGGALLVARNMQQARIESERVAFSIEKAVKAYRIQAGLTAVQTKVAEKRIGEISVATGVKQENVARIATEAASQGFVSPLSKGGVTETIISFLQSSNVKIAEAPLEEIVGGFGKYLEAAGKKLTGPNLLDLVMRGRGLFKKTPFQAKMFPDFAKARLTAAKVGLDETNFLSASAIVAGTADSAEASTGLKNTMLRLAAPEASGKAAMIKAGVDPKDIDLVGVGENFPQALKKLAKAIQTLPAEERLPTVKGIFGQKTATTALRLMSGAEGGLFEKFRKLQEDKKGFIEGIVVARGGVTGALARGEAELARLKTKAVDLGKIKEAEYLQQLNIVTERATVENQRYNSALVGNVMEFGNRFQLVVDKGFASVFGGWLPTGPSGRDEILARRKVDPAGIERQIAAQQKEVAELNKIAEAQKKEAEKQTQILDRIAGNTAKGPAVNRNANGE